MILIQIIALLYAAVRNTGRLRFLAVVFFSVCLPVTGSAADASPVKKLIVKRIHVFSFILLPLLLLCGCSSPAKEPVLETIAEEKNVGESSIEAGTEQAAAEGSRAGSTAAEKQANAVRGESSTAENAVKSSPSDDVSSARLLTVHVCGAVQKEGVYKLPAGSRICDAVEAAGGFRGDADKSYLNLAMEIEDAWQIRIPTKEETQALRTGKGTLVQDPASVSGMESPGVTDGTGTSFITKGDVPLGGLSADRKGSGTENDTLNDRINLNTASKEELMKIPGVGEAKAQRIIDYREENGRFEAIEDLMKVPGIKDASFQKMKEYITV